MNGVIFWDIRITLASRCFDNRIFLAAKSLTIVNFRVNLTLLIEKNKIIPVYYFFLMQV